MCIRCALAAVLATAVAEMPAPKFIHHDAREDQPEKAPYGNNNPAPPVSHQAEAAQETGTADTPVTPRHVRNEINRLLVRQEQQNAKLSAENEHLRHQLDGVRRMVEDANQHIDTMHAELRQARGAAETLKATVKILAVDSAKL